MNDSASPSRAALTSDEMPVLDWIAHHAGVRPDRLALSEEPSGRRFTYAQLHERVARVAGYLQGLGIESGDRVGFLALNSTDIVVLQFAVWRIGATLVALNFRLTAPELTFIINDAGPRVVLHDDAHADLARSLAQTTKVERWLQTSGDGTDSAFERAIAAQDARVFARSVEQSLSDRCMLMYSSGTTGLPKGVIFTHRMMLFSAVALGATADISSRSVDLVVMPLFHIGGMNLFTNPCFYFGATVIIQRSFDPGAVLRLFHAYEPAITHFMGVPAIYNALLAHPDSGATDFSRLTTTFVGAETVPDALFRAWLERGVRVREGFGMTETSAATCGLPEAFIPEKVGSAGLPFLHSEVRIVTADERDAETGEQGEIRVRGPMVTPGYWNRDDANSESFVDGWLRTGDIGMRDADGFIYVTDRMKDMYISGGENVYPAEVENTLYEMKEIAEVAVIGVPDEKWGEVGCAFVVPRLGASVTLEMILEHCATHGSASSSALSISKSPRPCRAPPPAR